MLSFRSKNSDGPGAHSAPSRASKIAEMHRFAAPSGACSAGDCALARPADRSEKVVARRQKIAGTPGQCSSVSRPLPVQQGQVSALGLQLRLSRRRPQRRSRARACNRQGDAEVSAMGRTMFSNAVGEAPRQRIPVRFWCTAWGPSSQTSGSSSAAARWRLQSVCLLASRACFSQWSCSTTRG